MIEKDFVINNFLDRIEKLETRLAELERRAWTGNVGNITYTGDLTGIRDGVNYAGYIFVPLLAPLVSTSWDGDSYSSTAKTLIDLSEVFAGVPDWIRAVLMEVSIRDSGSSGAGDYYLVMGPTNTAAEGMWFDCNGIADDEWERGMLIVPCDEDGNVYYEVNTSGALTMEVYLRVWGWWI